MRNEINCINCKNVNCFLKQYCSVEYLNKISTNITQNLYRKGDHIFREGNLIFGIYFIHEGSVKIIAANVNGREQIVRLANDGDIVGFRGLGSDKYYFNAVAMKDTSICFIETRVFQDTCKSNPDFAYNLLLFFAYSLRRTELLVKYQAIMNIREKVAEAFIYIYEKFGFNPQTKELNVELSRQDIGDIAGTTAEQVTRQLRDFEDQKLIFRKKRTIQLLNIKGLEYIVSNYKI